MSTKVKGCPATKEAGPINSEAVFYCDKQLGHGGDHVAVGTDWELCWAVDEGDEDG